MLSHHSSKMKTDTYLTPLPIIQSLGEFELDPCTPEFMPWETAKTRFTKKEDGLKQNWGGRVWLNPPYGKEAAKWLRKLAEHGNGIALVLARTETKDWHETIWPQAHAILFMKGRIYFHHNDGSRAKANCGAAPVLVAYGELNAEILKNSNIKGAFIKLR